jgi:hypothetical protein
MGISNLVTTAAGAVKSTQRGQAVASGTVTISAVDTSKTIVQSLPNGSAGTAAISGTVSAATLNGTVGIVNFNSGGAMNFSKSGGNLTGMSNGSFGQLTPTGAPPNYSGSYSRAITAGTGSLSGSNRDTANISGGTTTNFFTADYGAVLTNSTTITISGPCFWQVVEYY